MVTINIEKRHLFVFCIVIGIAAGMFFAYAYNTVPSWPGDAANFGHSVDEVDWGKIIAQNVKVRDISIYPADADEPLKLTGFSSPANYIDIMSGRDPSGIKKDLRITTGFYPNWNSNQLFLKGDGAEAGNVGIGTATPTEKLDVNGNVRASQVIIGSTDKKGLTYVSGINPPCPAGMIYLMRYWPGTTCTGTCSIGQPPICTTSNYGWVAFKDAPTTCTYWQQQGGGSCLGQTCTPQWTEALCIG